MRPGLWLLVLTWLLTRSVARPTGDPVGPPPRLRIAVALDSPVCRVGDLVRATFTVTNAGTSPFTYPDRSYDRGGRMDEYRLEVRDAAGTLLPDPVQWGRISGGLSSALELAPGSSFRKTVPLNLWASIDRPGTYAVTGIYRSLRMSRFPLASDVAALPVTLIVRAISPRETETRRRKLIESVETARGDDAREQAALALVVARDPGALPALVGWLDDPRGNLAFWADFGILLLGRTPERLRLLLKYLETHDVGGSILGLLRDPATRQLPEAVLEPLLRGMTSPKENVRASAAYGLTDVESADDRIAAAIETALGDASPLVQTAAIRSLVGRGSQGAADRIAPLLRSPNDRVRRDAAQGLARLKDERALASLRRDLAGEGGDARMAVEGLQDLATPAAREALSDALGHPNPDLRLAAAMALRDLGDARGREVLTGALNGNNASLRGQVVGWSRQRRGIKARATPSDSPTHEERWEILAWIDGGP